jgi:hypothetical protein
MPQIMMISYIIGMKIFNWQKKMKTCFFVEMDGWVMNIWERLCKYYIKKNYNL